MNDAPPPPPADLLAPARFSAAGRAVVVVARACALLGVAGVVFMTTATVYDVCARYFLNKPTTWATELSTYVLIATIFLGAGYAHLTENNVRVNLLMARLDAPGKRLLSLVTAWAGLIYVGVAGWQAVLLVRSDFVNGARIFSLLLTPTWMPKTPIAVGMCVLIMAILAEIDKLSGAGAGRRRLIPYVLFVAVGTALVYFGPTPPLLPGSRYDLGSVLVLAAVVAGAYATNGVRVGSYVALLCVASIGAFALGKTLGSGFLTGLLFAAVLLYLVIGVRIAFALALVGMLSVYFLTPAPFPVTLPDRAWSGVNSFSLTAVPLYVLMGAFLVRSKLSNELFSVMARLLARLPGGLAHAATAGCAIFAAVSGSSVATAATIGTVACPEMIRRGYSEKLTYGTIAAGGTLGILIPPSVPMIIYATNVGVPVSKLFIAGIVPGLLMMLSFMGVILVWVLLHPTSAPALPRDAHPPLTRDSVIDSGLVVALIAGIVVSLYAGVATASETGALGASLALIICVARGRADGAMVMECLLETMTVTSFIFLIVTGANIITFGFDYLRISQSIMEAAANAQVDRWVVFLAIIAVYVVLGTFLDSISMLVLTLPVVFPIVKSLGYDAIWFGVILVIMAEVGLIHPPMGMNLYVLQGIGKTVAMRTIAIGSLPFLGAMFAIIALLYVFPDIALFLPRHVN